MAVLPVLALPLLFISSLALAASDSSDYYDETDMFVDIPAVSAGSRMKQAREDSPSSVTVIDSEMITALAPNNLAEVFRLVPGFISFYVNGSVVSLSGHDLTDDDPRRLEVRINGRSVYVPSYPTISWESLGITADDIDYIEFVRGSNVPVYGSNAVVGAVSITTKSPLKESGTHVRATAGSQNTRNLNIRSNFQLGSGYGQVRVSHRQNDGFDGDVGESEWRRTHPEEDYEDLVRLDDDTNVGHVVLNTTFTPSLSDTLNVELGFSKGSFGIGDGDHSEEFADDDNTSYWLTAGWQRVEESQQWNWHLSLYDSESEHDVEVYLSEDEGWTPEELAEELQGNPDYLINYGFGKREATLWETELEYQYTFNPQLRMVSGLGFKYQTLKAPNSLETSSTVDNEIYYAFSNVEWRFAEKWLTNIGAMVENQKIDQTNISPRISIHYQLHPQHTFRVNASKAYRSPSLFEANRRIGINAYDIWVDDVVLAEKDIDAEEIESLEAAYYGSFFDGKIDIDWRAFQEDMDGGIDNIKYIEDHEDWVAANDINGKVRFNSNGKFWRATGYDMQIKWHPLSSTSVALAYANVRLDAIRINKIYRPPEPQKDDVPEHTASLFITHRFGGGWSASLLSYHQSFTNWRGGTKTDSYYRHDIALSKMMTISDYQLRFDAKVENLLDEIYLEYQTGNYYERAAFLSAAIVW